jgi:hypothetical protein
MRVRGHDGRALLPDVRSAIDRASRYIVEMQASNGAWPDFNLEVGRSDTWTTAYVGWCLFETEGTVSATERRYLRAALEQAAQFLKESRRADGSWGYNKRVPSDSDSTSWAALFLTSMGSAPGSETDRILQTFARRDGGFATYNAGASDTAAASAWTRSHPDVTPLVVRALAPSATREKALAFIASQRTDDGLWNSYWYRTPLYATLHNLAALAAAGRPAMPPAVPILAAAADRDPFDRALALEIVARFGSGLAAPFVSDAAAGLLETQSAEGWWAAKPMLRVTYDEVERPWELPGEAAGPLYGDDYFLFTTATVARALSLLVRDRGSIGADSDEEGRPNPEEPIK